MEHFANHSQANSLGWNQAAQPPRHGHGLNNKVPGPKRHRDLPGGVNGPHLPVNHARTSVGFFTHHVAARVVTSDNHMPPAIRARLVDRDTDS